MHIRALDGLRLAEIERLALGHALDHVDERHIGKFLGHNPVRGRGPHVPRADDADFLPHFYSPSRESWFVNRGS